jgi:hypothetical protein
MDDGQWEYRGVAGELRRSPARVPHTAEAEPMSLHGVVSGKASFRFQNSLSNSTMQKEDSPSH